MSKCYEQKKEQYDFGSGSGAVGRVVTSNTKDLRFESSHQQILIAINCIKKTKIKIKDTGNGLFLKIKQYEGSKLASSFVSFGNLPMSKWRRVTSCQGLILLWDETQWIEISVISGFESL